MAILCSRNQILCNHKVLCFTVPAVSVNNSVKYYVNHPKVLNNTSINIISLLQNSLLIVQKYINLGLHVSTLVKSSLGPQSHKSTTRLSSALWDPQHLHTGCPTSYGHYFGRVFLMLKYTDITQNTYVQS